MEIKEYTGKTVEDAITAASIELGLTSDKINYEVIEHGSSGFLGFGSKDAKIKVTIGTPEVKEEPKKEEAPKADKKPVKNEAPKKEASKKEAPKKDTSKKEAPKSEKRESAKESSNPTASIPVVKDFLDNVFKAMELEVNVNIEYDEADKTLLVDLSGPEMGVLIGKRGQTLDSLQYLANLAANRSSDGYVRVKIDTEDYRRRRKETLENLAKNCAYKVKRTRKPVILEAMNPYERRIIHAALQNDNYVTTHSEGEEPYRHIVITLKKNNNN